MTKFLKYVVQTNPHHIYINTIYIHIYSAICNIIFNMVQGTRGTEVNIAFRG